MRSCLWIWAVIGFSVVPCLAEDARTVLSETLAKYTEPAVFHVEGRRETTTADEIQREWRMEQFTLLGTAQNKYHFDIKDSEGWDVAVGNGTTEWVYQPWKNEYTRHPFSGHLSQDDPDNLLKDYVTRFARHYIQDPSRFKIASAEFLPEETLILSGQQIPCYVIRASREVSDQDKFRNIPQWTFWIEKKRRVLRKQMMQTRLSASVLQPFHQVDVIEVTYYTRVDLGETPDDSLFTFSPPPNAVETRRLFLSDRNIDLKGFPAPPLNLKTLDGKAFDASSLKGRTLLVDFWASWCVPCVQQMRSLASLEDRLGKEGLVVVGINWGDEDPEVARQFIAKNHYGWTNLRADNETTTAWMLNGVPLVAIVDPKGTIVYYHTGYEQPQEAGILNALREIDPRFAVGSTKGQP